MTASSCERRMAAVAQGMRRRGLDALLVSDPRSIWYLTGVWNEPFERLYVLCLDACGRAVLVVNRLFNVPETAAETVWYSDADDAVQVLSRRDSLRGMVGVDGNWPARFLLPLMALRPDARFVPGSACVDEVRGRKDAEEIALMAEASRINDVCMERAMAHVRGGMSELELAAYIDEQFRAEGADGPCFETIVSFGANAADPHHSPDATVLKDGDCVLIDMGCRRARYCSDMTRTNFFKSAPPRAAAVHDIVRTAQERAVSLVRPGVPLKDIDAAARSCIADAGYGDCFTHRLGHFCGQDDHEPGDVSTSSPIIAEEGMIFSIEPGIYLPGEFGVRIEDLVLVTADGCRPLNHVDHRWHLVGA